jgi:hypothetical protein
MNRLIHLPRAGVFAGLADPTRFAEAYVQYGAVTWPGELDLAPDAMYAEIKKAGRVDTRLILNKRVQPKPDPHSWTVIAIPGCTVLYNYTKFACCTRSNQAVQWNGKPG